MTDDSLPSGAWVRERVAKVELILDEMRAFADRLDGRPAPTPLSDLVSLQQAAGHFAVSESTVRRWLKAGVVAGRRVGEHGRWRVDVS